MTIWFQFLVCTTVILFAGSRLSKYGDVIAEKTGLGRTWIGVILIASVTSLPELVTGISSVAIFDVPDIAAGDVLGSCMFNILIIAMLDAMSRRLPITTRAHRGHVLTASFGILLLGLVSIAISAGVGVPSIGWIGVYSLPLLALYLVAMRTIFLREREHSAASATRESEDLLYSGHSKARTYLMFGASALLIIGAGSFLPHIGEEIARMTGLGQTFVGTILIALSTSLPEVVVCVAAVKIGAVDMAIGNVLGSNVFNIAILAVDDIFYTKGPLLSSISGHHIIAASAAMTMTAIVMIGLTYRAKKKATFLSYDALGIVLVYVLATLALYMLR